MSGLEAFMIEKKNEEIEYIVSKRFIDKNGEIIPFKLKPITSKENNNIRKNCYTKTPIPGKRNQFTREFDTAKYIMELALACVTFPNLNDKDLQDYYKVMGASDLLGAMLTPAEFDDLSEKLQELHGYNLEEKVEEAKN